MADRKCKCGTPMLWDDEKRQFGRLMKRSGFSKEEVKEMMPMCHKCMTNYLREHGDEHPRILKRWG
jgi:hypothetical protein